MSPRFCRHLGPSMVACSLVLLAPAAFAQDSYHPSDEALKSIVNGEAVTDGVNKADYLNGRPSTPRSNVDSSFRNDPSATEAPHENLPAKPTGSGGTLSTASSSLIANGEAPVQGASSLPDEKSGPDISRTVSVESPPQPLQEPSQLLNYVLIGLGTLGIAGVGCAYLYKSHKSGR